MTDITPHHPMRASFPLARTMPLDVGMIHFVGVGGIGMSGIAELLHNLGYKVQGSDVSANANVERLRSLGIEVWEGHEADNVSGAAVVVKSTAVQGENVEISAARARGIPVLRRSEMLSELTRLKMTLAVAGSHGKTTTTSMMAALFDQAGYDPTVLNGGILNAHGSNAYLGKSDWMVVEADESDGTFLKILASIAVITNLDPEHLDYWGDFDTLKAAFVQFLQQLPFYGFGVLCVDHPEVQALLAQVPDRRLITYGLSAQADVRAVNLRPYQGGTKFDILLYRGEGKQDSCLSDITLPMPGAHNVLNALASVAVGHEIGMSDATIKEALLAFKGVKRRFTLTGEVNAVRVIDDYGHHPKEIAATLQAARASVGEQSRLIAVMQPHRYTRLHSLFDEFCGCMNDADEVWVTPVFEAGETAIEGADQESLVKGVRASGHRNVNAFETLEQLAQKLAGELREGDMVVFMGAGSITHAAHEFPKKLEDAMAVHSKKQA